MFPGVSGSPRGRAVPQGRPCIHWGGPRCPRGVYLVPDGGLSLRVPMSLGSPGVFKGWSWGFCGSLRGSGGSGILGVELQGGPGVSGGALGGSQWIPGAVRGGARPFPVLWGCSGGNPVPFPFSGDALGGPSGFPGIPTFPGAVTTFMNGSLRPRPFPLAPPLPHADWSAAI